MEARPEHPDDLELAARAAERDPPSVEAFLQRMRCVPRMVQAKNSRCGTPFRQTDLNDLSQEVLLALWKKLGSFRGESSLEGWAHRFVHLEFMYRLRQKDRLPANLEDLALEPELREEDVPSFVEAEAVYRAIDRVGPPESDLIRMKHLEGLTFPQISERTGLAVNTLKTRYYRGLAKVRQGLASIERRAREEGSV